MDLSFQVPIVHDMQPLSNGCKPRDFATLDLRLLPFGLSCLSLFTILAYAAWRKLKSSKKPDDTRAYDEGRTRVGIKARLDDIVQFHGGGTIVTFMVAHLVGSLVLLCLYLLGDAGGSCSRYIMAASFAYIGVLSLASLLSKKWSGITECHNTVILFSGFAVYAYCDLLPLATYHRQPADVAEGRTIWVKIFLLALLAVIIPLTRPRPYIPKDAKNPMPVPNPEQTAPWISRFTFSYINHVVLAATKVSHLSTDQLPPLSDTDSSRYQVATAFPYIDPFQGSKDRHVLYGLLYHFRREYFTIALSLFSAAGFSFFAPIGLKNTLAYLEKGTASSDIRPWVWISMLLIGPIMQSMSAQWMLLNNTVIRVQLEALCTQLVFDHSLRIRVKADLSQRKGSSNNGAKDDKAKASSHNLGAINNLVTSDLANITGGLDFLNLFIQIPIQTILAIIFLYQLLGWSALVGVAVIVLFVPVQQFFTKRMGKLQKKKMKKTDARVQTITEALNVLRMVKMFGWERKMSKRLDEKREEELRYLWKWMCLNLFNSAFTTLIPTTTTLFTYLTYTLIMKQELNASKIFSSMAVFSMLRTQLERLTWRIPLVVQGMVSINRLDDFLKHSELLDSFTESPDKTLESTILDEHRQMHPDNAIGFNDATFSWSAEEADAALDTPSRNFRLFVEGEVTFKSPGINLIVGPTGSGKTSMLMALLGEMHFIPTHADSWYNLPRTGGIAYAAQESWVENATIRDNILFGTPYDQERYEKVLYQCALEQDLHMFEAGDMTEVGERGLTLSGGQKARVTLARAIYSRAQILLLDDVFAALDVHTSVWIAERCFEGDLVRGRTVILVTHNVALAGPISDFIVSIGEDGRIQAKGNEVHLALAQDTEQTAVVQTTSKTSPATSVKEVAAAHKKSQSDGKLVVAEEIAEGHVTWRSMKLLLSSLGGNFPVLFFVVWLSAIAVEALVFTVNLWFLGVWGTQYEIHPPTEVRVSFYLAIYALISFGNIVVSFLTTYFYNRGVVRSSRTIHTKLTDSVFGATLRWFDTTPTARIIARCTQDIGAIDGPVPSSLRAAVTQVAAAVTKLGAIVLFSPAFLLPGILVGMIGLAIGNLYLKAQLSVKREMSNSRSPLLGHFNAAIRGLISIRAYGAQETFRSQSLKLIDVWSRNSRISWDLNRWVGLRIDILGATFTCILGTYLVYWSKAGAATTGFSLNMALGFCDYLFALIRTFNNLEVQSNSLERVQAYLDIEHEPGPTPKGVPPAAWPTSGDLRVEKLSARYSPSGPRVLHDISFHINSGERIGVVGRTGSGKSSLTLALLRCIYTEGTVYYDGLATKDINLDALRSSITIIPQTPELLSGTLRQNLDPFGQHDDASLNSALKAAGLFSLQEGSGEPRFTLDTVIAGGGSNLSVGERQILALARAMIRGSKLLILDEATSAIDYKTDAIIQNTLRSQLDSGVTIITVAHRLQTIMDADRVMSLDNGRIAEFDAPKNLLKQDGSILRALVEESGDKDTLYALAGFKS
ncbi:multidrug resistance-associated ABC transporter [Agrocybe pediades]|nr:multidrug resistance-associated ABC transporter [Agrocybe pediades]